MRKAICIILAALALEGCKDISIGKNPGTDGDGFIDVWEPSAPLAEINVLHYIHQNAFGSAPPNEQHSYMLLLASIQGLLNGAGDDAVYLQTSNDYGWLQEFSAVAKETKNWGNDYLGLITYLLPKVKDKGYVLMKDYSPNDTGSYITDENEEILAIATSYAAAYQTVILTESIASNPLFEGMSCVADVREKTMRDVYDLFVSDENLFAKNGIISAPRVPHRNVDLAICRRWVAVKSADPVLTGKFFSKITPLSPRFSYNGPYKHEGKDVQFSSGYDLYALATGWCSNISTHERVRSRNLDKQVNTRKHQVDKERRNVHYVCILMSDGGNLEYFDSKFKTCFTHQYYGEFPLSFMMTPALKTYKALAQDWYMENMAENCSLVTSISGLGDIYPSSMTSDGVRAAFGRRTAECMADEGQSYFAIMDRSESKYTTWDDFVKAATPIISNIPDCKGVIFLGYAKMFDGAASYVNGVPMVSSRYSCLYTDPEDPKSKRSIADALHKMPKDPKSPDGYSIVLFNANPKSVAGKLPGELIMENVKLFADYIREDPDVEIVNASQFFELYNYHLNPSNK